MQSTAFTDWTVRMIIFHYHVQTQHAGPGLTLTSLREKFWLPQGRKVVAKVIRQDYMKCKRFLAKRLEIIAPLPLPQSRVNKCRPFQFVGLDYFGPLSTKEGKTWGIIFTCAATRAMHLDLANDCTTAQFILILMRFISRRGSPSEIISDNAKHFIATNKLLQNAHKNWEKIFVDEKLERIFVEKEIKWSTIAEFAPWQWGF